MGARMVPANGQTTKTKKIFYMSFWLERLSILLQIYTFALQFLFSKRGACFYWVPCFYWDIYGNHTRGGGGGGGIAKPKVEYINCIMLYVENKNK